MSERLEWNVSGMDCASCAAKVTRAVERMPGVSDVSVALMSERLTLTLAPGTTPGGRIEAEVRALGYGIAPRPARDTCPPEDEEHGHHGHARAAEHAGHDHAHGESAGGARWFATRNGRLVLLTGLLLAAAWGAEMAFGAGRWAFVAACLLGVVPIARRALAALRTGQPFTIESLMTVAATGALVIGAEAEAALVVFLFAVGEVLEGVAAGKARDGIRALSDLVPRTALLLDGPSPREVPAASLAVGQIVLVRPGDRIPADGEIALGTSGVDESPVTGESVPRTRGPGEAVFAGSINTEAALHVRVTKTARDNTIARIIRMVEEAEAARAPTERFIDRFSRWYMPLVVALSVAVILIPPLATGADWQTWIYRGLTLLLIGCPCALVISVPASIASALASGARRGLLLKGGAVVEAAAKVDRVAFDKTGTLTAGRPEVTDILPGDGLDGDGVLHLAAAVEAGSSHPLARAILRRADGLGVPGATEARALPGKGVTARVEGRDLTVASPRHAADLGALPAVWATRAGALEDEGKTVVALIEGATPLGLIALRDELREDAAEALRQIRAMGIAPVILSGDNARTVAAIAGELGTASEAGMLPGDKLARIRAMATEGGVMMVGDGINDAPALRQASVGVAMGSGTDVALETADAAILRDRVTGVPAMIRLSRAAMANIRQNVALALGLKAVFLVTSVAGITGLWIAVLADTGATVLVTLNALRLLTFDPDRH